jgi:hypothetical protein|tara:strand:- start:531 stop:890 length:360 start_codon:yes stop_codon:yes gene_type:complete
MAEYQDVKPGDLFITKHSDGSHQIEQVVIRVSNKEKDSGLEIRCYRKTPGADSGDFLMLSEGQWEDGAKDDYVPEEEGHLSEGIYKKLGIKLGIQLLISARKDLEQPVYKGSSLENLGL